MTPPPAAPPRVQAAVLTAPAPAGIAVILLRSVGDADPAAPLRAVFRPRSGNPPPADPGDRIRYGELVAEGETLDDVVVSRGPAGVEIHCHGGPAVVQRILAALAAAGAQVVDAEPLMRWGGPEAAGSPAPAIRAEALAVLPRVLTWTAAEILLGQSESGLAAVAGGALQSGDPTELGGVVPLAIGRRLIEPAAVVIIGRPNVGKSTLANALFGQPRSIVAPSPGTTRDYVREPADLGGFAVQLTDTAGLRSTDNPIEREGVRRAEQQLADADAVIAVLDGSQPLEPAEVPLIGRLEADRRTVWVRSKADLPRAWAGGPAGAIAVCAPRGDGLAELTAAVLARLGLAGLTPQTPVVFTERQERSVSAARTGDADARTRALRELLQG